MTDAQRPSGDRGDPLLRAVADNWDEIQRLADQQQRERLLGLINGTIATRPCRSARRPRRRTARPPPARSSGHPPAEGWRHVPQAGRPRATAALDLNLDRRPEPVSRPASDTDTVPVTIYLADEQIHAQVEKAVEVLLATAGLYIKDWDDPVAGSWFRRMAAGAKEAMQSPAGHEAMLAAGHALDSRLILAQDAEVTARLLQNLGPVLGALQPTKDAVIRVGALLIVKVDWTVNIFQLSAAQQVRLDHHPQLASSPHEIAAALQLASKEAAVESAE